MGFLDDIRTDIRYFNIDVHYYTEAERSIQRYGRLVKRLEGKIVDYDKALSDFSLEGRNQAKATLEKQLERAQNKKKLAEELVTYWEKETQEEEKRIRNAVRAKTVKRTY